MHIFQSFGCWLVNKNWSLKIFKNSGEVLKDAPMPQLLGCPSLYLENHPFRPFERGATILRGLTNHGDEPLPK